MKSQVRLIIASHLSDVQEMSSNNMSVIHKHDLRNRLNFCKYLLNKYADTTIEINAEEEYSAFVERVVNNN